MTTYGLDTLRESPPEPFIPEWGLLQRGEKTSPPRAKGPSLSQREDRRDSTARLQPDHLGITP